MLAASPVNSEHTRDHDARGELGHDFRAVETLPENDRTRYTITPPPAKNS